MPVPTPLGRAISVLKAGAAIACPSVSFQGCTCNITQTVDNDPCEVTGILITNNLANVLGLWAGREMLLFSIITPVHPAALFMDQALGAVQTQK